MSKGYVPVIHGGSESRPDEADTIAVAGEVAASLGRLGYKTEIIHLGLDLSALRRLAARKPYAVFNLVEALDGADALAALVPPVLDHLGLAYTGAPADAYRVTLSKPQTKERLRAHGLPTPDWWTEGGMVPREARVIVKSSTEHASLGLDAASVVAGADAAREIAEREARFGGRFFAEAFIKGRELNVAVLEEEGAPRVLPIPEIEFIDWPGSRPRIVDYEAKWDASSPYYHRSQRRFGLEEREPALARELACLALTSWRAFGLSGYARIDFRVDETGQPFILEVNANPCLAPDAGFVATAREAGLSFDELIEALVGSALGGAAPAAAVPVPPASGNEERWREEISQADIAQIRDIVGATGFFTPAEITIAAELAHERLSKGPASGYEFLLIEKAGELLGYACYGLTPGTDASYDLYWIVVAPGEQGRGHGRRLLGAVEERVLRQGGSKIYVDTSSTERYLPTRAFYERTGFERVAVLADFYRGGDGKVIYEKRLSPSAKRPQAAK